MHPAETPCPPDILAALEYGELTREQLRRFIAWEASLIGLTFEQAGAAAEVGVLPKTARGSDIEMLLRMWEGDATASSAQREEGAG